MLSLGANLVGSAHGSQEEARVAKDLASASRVEEDDKGKATPANTACLAWGDERAPDG
jgi:hypothetical protein